MIEIPGRALLIISASRRMTNSKLGFMNMNIIRILVSISLCAFFLISAKGDEPSLESLKALLKVTNVKERHEAGMSQMHANANQANDETARLFELSGDELEKFNHVMKESYDMLREKVRYEMMEEIYIQSYAEVLTQKEVDALVAFYSTSAGRSWLEKMPVVMQKNMDRTRQYIQPIMDEIQRDTDRVLQEL